MISRTAFWPRLMLGILITWASGSSHHRIEAGPGPLTLSVTGDWDGQFDGTIVERTDGGGVGESQKDSLVFSLQQSGSSVTGEVIFGEGRTDELRLPLSGSVEGNQFNYRAEFQVEDCWFIVEAETTLNPTATEFSGDQRQSNCEGTAMGRITSIKSESVPLDP